MASEEHLAILKQGVEVWNKWRKANPDVKPDFCGAHFWDANLSGANLTGANLHLANIRGANLSRSDLSGAHFWGADLINTDLTGANLSHANLYGAVLSKADLTSADLKYANLTGVNLERANLVDTYLIGTNLSGANLTNAKLLQTQALGTNFEGATLTGACIENWNINASTNLKNVLCDYVYLKRNTQERRPSNPTKNFAPGEFTALFQKALETVDLIFADGIDWKAFFQSFQELQSQYADQELSIQAIEKKASGAFVIRLETPAVDVDKAAIESAAMEKYQAQLQLLEAQYRTQLHAKDEQIADYRQQNTSLIELAKLAASRPVIINNTNNNTVEANAVSNSQSSGDTYNGPIKATNFSPHGTAIGGTFNDYSQTIANNLDEIQQLIATLRSQAEQFPPDARDDAEVHLGDLEADLKHPDKQDPKRIKAKLMALLAIAVGLGGAIATATDFSNNVLELGKKFGVELVHSQGTQSSPAPQSSHSQGTQTVDVKRLEGGH